MTFLMNKYTHYFHNSVKILINQLILKSCSHLLRILTLKRSLTESEDS